MSQRQRGERERERTRERERAEVCGGGNCEREKGGGSETVRETTRERRGKEGRQ